jgi:hypothetical protein
MLTTPLYSASAKDRAIESCFLFIQHIGPEPRLSEQLDGIVINAITSLVRISEPDEVQCRVFYIVNPKGDGALYISKDMLCILPM